MTAVPAEAALVLLCSLAAAALAAYFAFRRGFSAADGNLKTLLEAVPDIAFIVDADNNITMLNSKTVQALGLAEREALGRKCWEVFHKTDARPADCACIPAPPGRTDGAAEFYGLTPGIRLAFAALPLSGPFGRSAGCVHIAADAADRERAELRSMQSGKMEALGRLAGGLAHEFNNTLSIISSAFYMLKARLASDETGGEDAAAIQKAIASASNLTRHLLTLSQRQVMDLKVTDLNALIKESVQITHRLLGEDTRIETDLRSAIPPVITDPAQFNKLLMNIMSRTEQSGGKREITLRTEQLMLGESQLRPGGRLPEARSFVRLSVRDTAYAVKKESVKHIFEPYFEARSMNLAIAYGIARQHNGWIDVAGDESGIVFEIYLPAADGAAQTAAKTPEPAVARPKRALRILLAEDDDDLRTLTARALRKNGHQVFDADCAEKAMELFDSRSGDFDALVSDVVMPDKSGVALADEIRKVKPDIDILLMSGYIDEKVHIDAIRTKGYKFIYKPFDVDALLIMLR